MRKAKLHFFLSVALLLCLSFSDVQSQQVFKITPKATGYLEYLPPDYNSNSNKYPVLIFLHGIGERSPNSNDFNTLKNSANSLLMRHGPPKHIKNGYKFPFIVITPQLKSNYGTWPAAYIDEVLEHVKTYLRIDPARIYVTGLSLGGGGAWVYAETYAHKIAAVVPICGGYNTPSKACNISSNKVAVWGFHGDKDYVVNMSRTVNMINAIKGCSPGPNPTPLLTIYAGVDHNAWDRAYRTDNSLHNPNIYQWMLTKSRGGTSTPPPGNSVPVANAGPDKNITLPTNSVVLNGSGSDSDGSISSYTWSKVSGGSASMTGTSTPNLTASGLVQGSYTFRLTVKDNKGASKYDDVKVNVAAASSGSTAPVVNAGPDKSINSSTVTLTGSASDPDGIASYEWLKVSGPPAWMTNPKTPTLTASNLAKGTYTFRLTVKDKKGTSSYDEVKVTVGTVIAENTPPPSGNAPPAVNAGPDKTISGTSVTLQGSASDPDGSISAYEWWKVSGPPAWMTNPKSSTLTASNLKTGTYIFRLTVKDNKGASSYDEVKVVVGVSTARNAAPSVNAGADKTISGTSVTLYGSASDADGSITGYEWWKVSGPPAWMTNPKTPTLTASNLRSGTYIFRLTVKDNKGASSYDEVKVAVQVSTASNAAPHVNAGPDKTIHLPSRSVTLNGNASDPDGYVTAYEWKKIAGPPAWMNNPKTKTLTASNLILGTYTFRLTVRDNKGAVKYDDAKVKVVASTSSVSTHEEPVKYADSSEPSSFSSGLEHTMISSSSSFLSHTEDLNSEFFNEIFEREELSNYNMNESAHHIKKNRTSIIN